MATVRIWDDNIKRNLKETGREWTDFMRLTLVSISLL